MIAVWDVNSPLVLVWNPSPFTMCGQPVQGAPLYNYLTLASTQQGSLEQTTKICLCVCQKFRVPRRRMLWSLWSRDTVCPDNCWSCELNDNGCVFKISRSLYMWNVVACVLAYWSVLLSVYFKFSTLHAYMTCLAVVEGVLVQHYNHEDISQMVH